MTDKKPLQKLISFCSADKNETQEIERDMKEGWIITQLLQNGEYFVGIMEKEDEVRQASIFIPPTKKIKLY